MLKLVPFQAQLEGIYDVELPHAVDDFLITDRKLARYLESNEQVRTTEEKLLLSEDGDNLDLSLFLDANLVSRLSRDNPVERLHDGNLSDFCIALEGVSHFVHLVWHALEERQTSCLELELQAEVDKFVTCLSLLSQQGKAGSVNAIHQRLFQHFRYDPELEPDERQRYEEANLYGARYCEHLAARYLHRFDADEERLSAELRWFYRLDLRDKIAHIKQAPL